MHTGLTRRAALATVGTVGVQQRPAIVGTVIRTVPHDKAPAGMVASFIAVRQDGK